MFASPFSTLAFFIACVLLIYWGAAPLESYFNKKSAETERKIPKDRQDKLNKRVKWSVTSVIIGACLLFGFLFPVIWIIPAIIGAKYVCRVWREDELESPDQKGNEKSTVGT